MPFTRGRSILQRRLSVVNINQYPVDKEQEGLPVMVQAHCPVGLSIFRNLTFRHTCDTAGGASGSGMYARYSRRNGNPAVMLVHTGRLFNGDNRAVLIDKPKFRQLCYWIESTGGNVGGKCPSVKGSKQNLEVVSTREKET
eukprot:m.107120 g.107120  ORF g.107120 m.107120 type:complete len:141 (+) comp37282_c0_seq1:1467-1889(+)